MYNQNNAFTLVELIVVITILTILGTIAFISLQGYSQDSRDSARISDISSLKTSLELFHLEAGKYPLPSTGVNITYSGAIVWNQGTFGETVYANVYKLDRIPKDPLTNSSYTYSITQGKNEYQLGGIVEGDTISMNNEQGIMNNYLISQTNAGTVEATAYISGNYNGQITKSLSGVLCNVLSIPTIIASDIETSTDLEEISNNKRFVYSGEKNLPDSYRTSKFKFDGGFNFKPNKLVAYTDTGSCNGLIDKNDATARIKLLQGLQEAYTGTTLQDIGEIKNILALVINPSNPNPSVTNFAGNLVNNSFGGNITITNGVSKDCDSGIIDGYNYGFITNTNLENVTKTGSIQNGTQNYTADIVCDNGIASKINENIITNCTSGFFQAGIKCVKYFAKKIGSIRNERVFGSTIDNDGNIYITGQFMESTNILGQTLTSNINYNDGFLAKIDSNGNLVWAKRFGGTNHDSGQAVAVDSVGNIYITGSFFGTADIFGQNLTSYGNDDLFIAKLDSDGNLIWSQKGGSTVSGETGKAITIDNDGYIYLAGQYGGTSTLFGSSYNSGGYTGAFLVKLDENGNKIWLKTPTGGLSEYINDITVDNNGSVYAIGTFANTANVFGYSLTGNAAATDIYVSKLNASSGSGTWSKRAGGTTGYDTGEGITVDSDGNIYITGGYQLNADFMGVNLTNAGSYNNAYVVKLNSSGTAVWGKQSIAGQAENGKKVKLDSNGNVFILGEYYDTVTVFGYSLTTYAGNNIFLIKLDNDGNGIWGKRAGGTGGEDARGLNIDSDGILYVSGNFLSGWFDLFGIGFSNGGSYDIFLGKLSNNGTYN